MLASPAEILRDFPARVEAARKAGNEAQAKQLSEQIDSAKSVKVEEIPAPVLTFDSELRIHVGDETVQVWHTPPAHTDGDAVIYFEKANVLHMGDDFFNKVIPFIDVAHGGSVKGPPAGGSAAAPVIEPSGAAPIAPARIAPRPSSMRRFSTPLPATASLVGSFVPRRR